MFQNYVLKRKKHVLLALESTQALRLEVTLPERLGLFVNKNEFIREYLFF